MLNRIAAMLHRSGGARRRSQPTEQSASPALDARKRAVAAALARNSVEIERCRRMRNRMADLEKQFLKALATADAERARHTATELARLEKECADSATVQKVLYEEIDRLKRELAAPLSESSLRAEARP